MAKGKEDWLKDILIGDQEKQRTEDSGDRVNGMNRAAALLGKLDTATRDRILGKEGGHSGISKQIRERMFTFEDLVLVDKRHMPMVLKQIGKQDLILAMKKCSPAVKDWIYQAMSSRLAGMFQEDLDATGPTPLRLVEEAQQKIAKIIRRLAEDGKIAIKGHGEEYV
ncbi:MAG: hypothetical protein HQM13_11695 [SAR324 cluster bacterium]|nr:hypothetical protein [SAR324 cluster bacterium]